MKLIQSLALATICLGVLNIAGAQQPIEGDLAAHLEKAQLELTPVFSSERFPNILVTPKGTVVATFGSKNIRARRSEDGGKTWGDEITIGKGFQGGTIVDETNGHILAFVEDEHPPAPLTVYRSTDDGKTWKPEKPTILPDSKGNLPSMHMNEHGITLRHGKHKGRLLRASRYYGKKNDKSEWPNHYTNAIYSDDQGKTWHTSDPFPENGTGEATLAELSDGRIYYNSRVHWQDRPKNRRRREAWRDDGGQTWKNYRIIDILPDGPQDTNYGCMGGLTRLSVRGEDILLYSNCDSEKGRVKGTVWASFDGGKTWPIQRLVFKNKFAYSSMTSGRPGTPSEGQVYLHFEGGPDGASSTVARFNLQWVLGGKATGEGNVPEKFAAKPKKPKPFTPGGKYRVGDMNRPRPAVINPGAASTETKPGQAPSDAIVLFDGTDMSHWDLGNKKDKTPWTEPKWKIENGYMEIVPKTGSITSKQKFGSSQIHIEWATPAEVKGSSQGRGNSGVYINGHGEVQVLDSYQNDTYPDGQAAAIYSNYPPLVNASRKPGEWQSYDIIYYAPEFKEGKMIKSATFTVLHNGILVHHGAEVRGDAVECTISLQDHSNPVRYRNIWVRPLKGYDSEK